MKISELIKELEKIKDDSGDLDVCCWPYDGQTSLFNVSEVKVSEHISLNKTMKVLIES